MKEKRPDEFFGKIELRYQHFPWSGQIELTYRCRLKCIHCFCKGSEDKEKELTTGEFKKILNEVRKEGCVWLCFTGGDPLVRKDFWELYYYAKSIGFLVTLFLDGHALTERIIETLYKSPPFYIEVTLNGMTKDVYESITQVRGSFEKSIKNIRLLAKNKLPLIIKSNCLKQNIHEIHKIRSFSEALLGKGRKSFKYDQMIYPRLNGDKTPCQYRISPEEFELINKQDLDSLAIYNREHHNEFNKFPGREDYLYRCDSFKRQFVINPYGRLKICNFLDKFSVDLRTTTFRHGFYRVFPMLLKDKFKTDSKCRSCSLRLSCYFCPARAYLETGNEESAVADFCRIAERMEVNKCQRRNLGQGFPG